MPRNSLPTRRRFLAASLGAAAAPWIVPCRAALGAEANERLNLAIVGPAGYCAAAFFMPGAHLMDKVQIVALCDVDRRKAARALQVWKERAASWPASTKEEERRGAAVYRRLVDQPPPMFEDFRTMLDKMGRGIDAVVVATPDHTHAVASAAALRAGKHVICEKPLTIAVRESRALRDLALAGRRATSLGNQGTQSGSFRRGVELIREGVLGPIEQVHVWFSRGGMNLRSPPQGTPPVPPELNWDLWLGPVAWREYHPEWIARTNWRDTSAGQLGNFGPHTANLAFLALNVADLWQPPPAGAAAPRIEVEAECSEVNRLSFPVWEKMHWRVPARGAMPPVAFTWHHGRLPDYGPGSRELIEGLIRGHGGTDADVKRLVLYAGAMLVGAKGVLVTDSHNTRIDLLPRERFAGVETDRPQTLPASRGHYNDWLQACRGGPAPWSRFEHTAVFNEFLMLGDIATRFPGEKLAYDPQAAKIVNHAEADAALGYEYRKGWAL